MTGTENGNLARCFARLLRLADSTRYRHAFGRRMSINQDPLVHFHSALSLGSLQRSLSPFAPRRGTTHRASSHATPLRYDVNRVDAARLAVRFAARSPSPHLQLLIPLNPRSFLAALGICGYLVAVDACASTIVMQGGTRIENAEILERGAEKWRLKTPFGIMEIAAASVLSVDGQRAVPVSTPPQETKLPSAPPEAISSATPSSDSGNAGARPTAEKPPVLPSEGVKTGRDPTIEANAPGQPDGAPVSAVPSKTVEEPLDNTSDKSTKRRQPKIEYRRDPRFDMWLGGLGVVFLVWLGGLIWVQRDLASRGAREEGWNTLAILLPGVGVMAYGVAKAFGRGGDIAPKGERRGSREVFKRGSKANRGMNLEFLDDDRGAFGGELEEGTGLIAARSVLEEAIEGRASDIHIEPQENEYRVRLRIDGTMMPRGSYSREEGRRLVSALKTLAQIDVSEKRRAQDGRFRVRTDRQEVDLRVATANSIFGEKLVIRLLDRKGGVFDLGELGMPPDVMDRFHQTIHSRAGMIVGTGPTGSGKTSTLYAALGKLDASKLNIMTIEDPAEYELAGATQIPVNVKAGVTYESGLRSILRQDPDVIFVGEMRDAEAAKIAIRAALTGHLVFTTLHTKDALSTIVRLEEMGVGRETLSSSLLMLVAQRLVRVLCKRCRVSYEATGQELSEVGVAIPTGTPLYRAHGCNDCEGIGYRGRTGIFELVVLDDAMRHAIHSGTDYPELQRMAKERGFKSYRDDGAAKAIAGITSIEEVLEAT